MQKQNIAVDRLGDAHAGLIGETGGQARRRGVGLASVAKPIAIGHISAELRR